MSVPLALTVPLSGCTAREGVEVAQASRSWGYSACWAMEVDGPDAFTSLAALAATTDLDLGVAVVPVQTRSAFVLGMTSVALAQLSSGRFTLGIGASSEVIVSRFAGQPWTQPLDQLRESALALRPMLEGRRSTFDGQHVRVGGYRPPTPPPAPVPLYFGSLNPRSLRLAGELADGVCVNQVPPRHVPALLEHVTLGATAAGRDLDPIPLVARIFCLVTDDVPAARSFVSHVFAPYVATTGYNRAYRWMGFEDEADAILEAAAAGDRARMVEAYTDRVAREIFVIGDADAVVARLVEYVDAGVTIPVIAPLTQGPEDAAHTLREIGKRWPSTLP